MHNQYFLNSFIKKSEKTQLRQGNSKRKEGGFLCMLIGTLGASVLGNILTREGVVRTRTQ